MSSQSSGCSCSNHQRSVIYLLLHVLSWVLEHFWRWEKTFPPKSYFERAVVIWVFSFLVLWFFGTGFIPTVISPLRPDLSIVELPSVELNPEPTKKNQKTISSQPVQNTILGELDFCSRTQLNSDSKDKLPRNTRAPGGLWTAKIIQWMKPSTLVKVVSLGYQEYSSRAHKIAGQCWSWWVCSKYS